MRHLNKGRKFGRVTDQRRALMRSMASSFFLWGKIKTTESRAKELRPYVEKFLTRAKNPALANRRILRKSFTPAVTQKIVLLGAEVGNRRGGYTRIVKMGIRKRDGARIALLELITNQA